MKRVLRPVSRPALLGAFLEAFGDYAVNVGEVTERWLDVRCVKNAVDFDASVGAFDGDRMVGFTLIGIDKRQGERIAYDAATGIVPDHRGQGLARRMFDHALPGLRERGVTSFLLEVLQGNEPAIRAYTRAGFEVVRELRCFELDVEPVRAVAEPPAAILPADRATVLGLRDEIDWLPSWENDFPAIERIPDDLVIFGAFEEGTCIGAVAYTPVLNWIMMLAVRRDRRREGIGTALVRHLAAHLPEVVPLVKLNNVDASDGGMLAFLERNGFRHKIDQFEMSLRL
jgi:ribosomal protein S18 acetylase RimI-like enzyme